MLWYINCRRDKKETLQHLASLQDGGSHVQQQSRHLRLRVLHGHHRRDHYFHGLHNERDQCTWPAQQK